MNQFRILGAILGLCSISSAFAPLKFYPLQQHGLRTLRLSSGSAKAIEVNDRVAVIGASGNVGRLVALRLADMGACKVRALCRSPERARKFLSGTQSQVDVEVLAADTTKPESLTSVLDDCEALVIVTGTTAFPTLAWRGGNTPQAVDAQGVQNVLAAWKEAKGSNKKKKRVVLMSSIGVERRTKFPFVILNAAGVLDAKAVGEDALRTAAGPQGWLESYSIVRPGQLIGGPYENNYYLGTLAKLDRPARSILLWDETSKGTIELGKGDALLGDTLRSTVAELLVTSLLAPIAAPDFAVVNTDGARPSEEQLAAMYESLLE